MIVEVGLISMGLVVGVLLLVVVLHLAGLAVTRISPISKFPYASMAALGLPILLGSLVLWQAFGRTIGSAGMDVSLPSSLRASTLLLYLAGCLVYLEVRSLVSRGYSLRILVDLLDRGGEGKVETLKIEYGGGMGLQGLLEKRLCGLAQLRLLRREANRVGPLTSPGQILAALGFGFRHLLRLNRVG